MDGQRGDGGRVRTEIERGRVGARDAADASNNPVDSAMSLGDWGADVVKIERIEGDPMRSVIRNGLSPAADGVAVDHEGVRHQLGTDAVDLGAFRTVQGMTNDGAVAVI